MIRGRGYRLYRPSQLLTGHVDDFPLVPETPVDIVPRPILSPSSRSEDRAPEATVSGAREINRDPERPSGTEGPHLHPPAEGRPMNVLPAAPIVDGLVSGVPIPPPPGNKVSVEYLEAAKEMAAISPSIANEMLRILENDGCSPAVATAIVKIAAPKSKSRPRKKSHPKKKKASPPPERLSRLELHQSHCEICGYEDQDAIDEAFVSWENVSKLAEDYDVDRRAIYRHAHATGLYAKRDRNIRRALGRIIQKADFVTASADSVVRAIKILTHVNARGDWVQPPTHVIFSAATAQPAAKRSDTPCKVKKGLKP